jgi:hypothetical protein
MTSIFAIPRKRINAEFRRLAKRKYKSYDDVVKMLMKQCDRFPPASVAWPTVLKRKGDRIEIGIKVANALSRAESAKYKQSVQYYGRPPASLAHKRVLDGTNEEMVQMALDIIKVAKEIAEALTVLESTK